MQFACSFLEFFFLFFLSRLLCTIYEVSNPKWHVCLENVKYNKIEGRKREKNQILTLNIYKFNKSFFFLVSESKWYSSIAWIENNLCVRWNLLESGRPRTFVNIILYFFLYFVSWECLFFRNKRKKNAACLLFLTCFIFKNKSFIWIGT